MAKIIKIGSQNTTLTSKTANLSKTSRQGNITNPFKFSNFEGNTLQFADVFEGFEPKKQNKLRMIASSVAGSMNKMRSSITEPIINFVNRVRGGISSAWNYANNTNLSDLPGIKSIANIPTIKKMNDVMNTPIHLDGCLGGLRSVGKSMSAGMEFLNTDIKDVGKTVSAKMDFLNTDMKDIWNNMVSKIHTNKYTSDMSVSELEQAWKAEEALEGAV